MKKLSVMLLLIVAAAAGAQKESILIGTGDQIDIEVFDTTELSGLVHVSDSGEVRLTMGEKVKVAGLSPMDAAQVIENALINSGIMNRPHVTVSIEKYATQKVSVAGQVKNPGNYDLDTPRSIVDVLTMAGGLDDLADRNITIQRRSTQERINYFQSNNSDVALDKAIMIFPGDEILVPKVGVVYVLGDVGKPGGYPMNTDDSKITALQAIAFASGINNTAATSKAVLLRKGPEGYEQVKLPVQDLEKGKVPDIQLLAEDIIYVPFSFGRNLAVNGAQIVAAAGEAAIIHP